MTHRSSTISAATTDTVNAPEKKLRRVRMTTSAWIAVSILAFWILVSVFAPLIAPFGEGDMVSTQSFAYPEEASFLGTDYLGRDMVSRIAYGARMTLGLAAIATAISFSIGIGLGFVAAISRGWTDQILSRLVDAIMAFPSIMLALIIIGGVGTSLPVVILTVALIDITRVFRVARALALDVMVMDFVEVAKVRGEGPIWIMLREILPNTAAPLMAELGVRYTFAILFISSLSFLGLGVQPPGADWGVMVKENLQGLLYGSPAALTPAFCIASVSIAVNILVDWYLQQTSGNISEEILQ